MCTNLRLSERALHEGLKIQLKYSLKVVMRKIAWVEFSNFHKGFWLLKNFHETINSK